MKRLAYTLGLYAIIATLITIGSFRAWQELDDRG